MKQLLAGLALTLTLVAPAVADDASPASGETMASGDCARARKAGKVCELTIEDEVIEGGVPSAGEMNVGIIKFVRASSLIRVRKDFIPEILKSAEDL
jgi:hypothetical protein